MEIDQLKLNLIKTALLYGINHPFTISTSQDLDKLIIEYQKLAIK
ncbi:aspartyl-phosphate phosphatase Spo0E family protein [Metabacillus halosaccharovorans]|nr:aspartyl-phosphate phosphatase Spo0E family protein [Metabacillus halosaccharovorans]